MDITEAERFVHAWGIWKRGHSHGVIHALETVEKMLCRDQTTAQQREVLQQLHNDLTQRSQAG